MEEFGEPTVGLWCPDCLLPSGAAQNFMLMFEGKPDHLFRFRCCLDCGRDLSAAHTEESG
jgi:hypothetical protein